MKRRYLTSPSKSSGASGSDVSRSSSILAEPRASLLEAASDSDSEIEVIGQRSAATLISGTPISGTPISEKDSGIVTKSFPYPDAQNGRVFSRRFRSARPIKWLLRSSAIATICGICASVGFVYGMHVVNRVHEDEFLALRSEVASLKEKQAQVATQSAFLKTVFDDLVTSNDQMRQIQDAPQRKRTKGRAWYAIGGGNEPRVPMIESKSERIGTKSGYAAISHQKVEQVVAPDPSLVIERWAKIFESLPLGIPVDGYISSPYGRRVSPTSGRLHNHSGIDFAVDQATNVVATGQGIVRQAGYNGAYGLSVTIDHGNGWSTVYGHLSAIRAKVGQRLCRGQTLGHVGSTGNSTGPHLHYEVRKANVTRNPAPFVEFPRIARALLGMF